MKNLCIKCEKNLTGSRKSAVKEDGSFYLACSSCGNVHYVTVDANGLTTISNTLEGSQSNPEVRAQMIEAKELFEKVNGAVSQYIPEMNGEKRSASELVSIDYDAVKDTAKESVKEVVKSIANSVGAKGIDLCDSDAEAIADIVVKTIKGECKCSGKCACKK